MKTVLKYPVQIDDLVTIRIPVGAQILRVDMQPPLLCLWALVDINPGAALEERVLRIAGTGESIEDHHAQHYLGTFFLYHGALVYHVFEVTA